MTAERFVEIFGTHVAFSGYYGGLLECDYYYCNRDTKWSTEEEQKYGGSIAATIKSVQAGVEASVSISNSSGIKSSSSFERFSANGKGGKNFNATSLDSFKAGISSWIESLDEQDYNVLVDLPDNSLVGIWELFPDEYERAADKVKSYFNFEREKTYNQYLNKCLRNSSDPEYELTEDIISFKLENCALDNGYNPAKQDSGAAIRHQGFEFVKLMVGNVVKNTDGTYTVPRNQALSLKLYVQKDLYGLPLNSGESDKWLCGDTYSGTVYGTNLSGEKLEKGAYYIQVRYTNGLIYESNARGIFRYTKSGDTIDISGGIDTNKTIESISIVVVYEICTCIPKESFTDWRCSATLNFS
jgi:hypothetical protein